MQGCQIEILPCGIKIESYILFAQTANPVPRISVEKFSSTRGGFLTKFGSLKSLKGYKLGILENSLVKI